MTKQIVNQGACLCGSISYKVAGPLRPVVACHCDQCRRTSGHHVAATSAKRSDLQISGEEFVTWFTSSPGIRRGFCRSCGSNLFWDNRARSSISIMAGTLDNPTKLTLVSHIYTGSKGNYYEITDGLPNHLESDPGLTS